MQKKSVKALCMRTFVTIHSLLKTAVNPND